MKSSLFIGIDISKSTLDVSILSPVDTNTVSYGQFSNSTKGFAHLLKWVKQHSEGVPADAWKVCMENTGIYSLELNCFLHEKGIWQCLENALQIKRSMGVLRGKTDKADSGTIALYAYRFQYKLKPYVLPGKTLLRLRALFAQRERLGSLHVQLQLGIKSLKGYEKQLVKDIQRQNETLLKGLNVQIKAVDKALSECLKEDQV